MSLDALKKHISEQYSNAGFDAKDLGEDYILCYQNRFSVHYIYLLKNLGQLAADKNHFDKVFESDYLMSDNSEFFYWNYYSIYIIDTQETTDEFRKATKMIEEDLRMSRKFLLTAAETNKLPPFYIELGGESVPRSVSLWEEEWEQAIGKDLYGIIVASPKSKIKEILSRWVDDKTNPLK